MVKRVPNSPTLRMPAAPLGGGIGDVQQRDGDVGLDVIGHLVHGVGADDDHFRAGALQAWAASARS